MIERRTQRSDRPYVAAQLFLERCAERHGCSAIALVSDEGLLVAGVGAEAEAVGACASAPTSDRARAYGPRLQAFSMDLGSQHVHVGVLGAVPAVECVEALTRIFRTG